MIRRRSSRLHAGLLLPLALFAVLLAAAGFDALAQPADDDEGSRPIVQGRALPDLARGRAAAAAGQLEEAEADLAPLAEAGYVEAQIALARLYAHMGTPERVAAAIGWLRTAGERMPEQTELALGRLLQRQSDTAQLDEAQALLERAYQRQPGPDAVAALVQLYTQHPQRDAGQHAAALVERAEQFDTPETLGAAIAWYRSSAADGDHRARLVQLCRKALDSVPECYIDLVRDARARGNLKALPEWTRLAGEAYDQGRVAPQTLAGLARVLVDAQDPAAEDESAAALAPLPVRISDVSEDEGEAAVESLRTRLPAGDAQSCASAPLNTAAEPAPQPQTAAAEVAAQPELANPLLERLLKGADAAPVLAAGVVVRYPYLLPGADIEQSLKTGVERGVPEARLYLGQLYLQGTRAPRDPQGALQSLQLAGENPATALQAHYLLGRLYQQGYLDESEPRIAAEYLMWAARRGYAPADGALARLFANGKGLCPNLLNAYVFATLGAREGSVSTARLAQQLGERLGEEQRARGETIVADELALRPSAYQIPANLLAGRKAGVQSAPAAAEPAPQADAQASGDQLASAGAGGHEAEASTATLPATTGDTP